MPEEFETADSSEKRQFQSHGRDWFKSEDGGRELAGKVLGSPARLKLEPVVLPFVNAVRLFIGLKAIGALPS